MSHRQCHRSRHCNFTPVLSPRCAFVYHSKKSELISLHAPAFASLVKQFFNGDVSSAQVIAGCENVPRKKGPFYNFCTNSLKIRAPAGSTRAVIICIAMMVRCFDFCLAAVLDAIWAAIEAVPRPDAVVAAAAAPPVKEPLKKSADPTAAAATAAEKPPKAEKKRKHSVSVGISSDDVLASVSGTIATVSALRWVYETVCIQLRVHLVTSITCSK